MPLTKGESMDVTVILDTTGVAEGAVNLTGDVSSAIGDPDLSNNTITLTSGAVTTPVDPVDPGASGELPYTGSRSTGPLVGGGVMLLIAGLILVGTTAQRARRRRI
jgi:LPXTG-motif cell wall-anchored protein